MERQRGAGARDISLAFDLELPGVPRVSKTPLKPQRSGRPRKTPQPELPSSRSTRKTPKATKIQIIRATRRTPATARGRKIEGAIAKEGDGDGELVYDAQGSGPAQHDGRGPTKKRKALEDIPETQPVAPPKKRRKRKSIGQQSLARKPRTRPGSVNTADFPKATSRARKSRVAQTATEEAVAEKLHGVVERPPTSSGLDVAMREQEEVPIVKKRRGRKRKSIGRIQRPGKKTPAVQQDGLEDQVEVAKEVQEPAKVESPTGTEREETEIKAKPRKRKRKAIVQSPKKRKKPSPKEAPLVPKEDADVPVTTAHEELRVSPVTPVAPVEKKGARRGRKPKSVPTEHAEPSETLIDPVPTIAEAETANNELSEAGEVHFPAAGNPIPPKRRGRKRNSTGQDQRLRKKTAVKPRPRAYPDNEAAQPEVESIDAPVEAPVAPVKKGRGRPKKLRPSLKDSEDLVVVESLPDKPNPGAAPKKRGRPKKVDSTINAKKLKQAHQAPIEDTKDEELPQEPSIPDVVSSTELPPSVQGAYAPTATQERSMQIPAVTKKRGRPKKQIPAPPVAEPTAEESTFQRPIAKPRRREPKTPAPNLPANSVPLQSHRKIRTQAFNEPDPVSSTAPIPPKAKPKTRPTTTKRHHPTTQKPPSMPRPNNNIAILNQPTAITSAPPSPFHPSLADSPPPPPPHCATPIETPSLTEEQALQHDLNLLRSQRAAELAEQRERDVQTRLETLSASVRKRKAEMGAKMLGRAKDGVRGGEVRKGLLDGFVFSRVVARKGDAVVGGGDEIDPELQELLSRVKGKDGKGGGGVVGIF